VIKDDSPQSFLSPPLRPLLAHVTPCGRQKRSNCCVEECLGLACNTGFGFRYCLYPN
jgi:hypothetical protein